MDIVGLGALFESRAPGPDLPARYPGTLLGVAAGNALGLPAEGLSRQAIATKTWTSRIWPVGSCGGRGKTAGAWGS
jgi:ADP-ribosylglycohydrolase